MGILNRGYFPGNLNQLPGIQQGNVVSSRPYIAADVDDWCICRPSGSGHVTIALRRGRISPVIDAEGELADIVKKL